MHAGRVGKFAVINRKKSLLSDIFFNPTSYNKRNVIFPNCIYGIGRSYNVNFSKNIFIGDIVQHLTDI